MVACASNRGGGKGKYLITWSGLSESNRHLNLGKSEAHGESGTYEALSGALSSSLEQAKTLNVPQVVPKKRVGSENQIGGRIGNRRSLDDRRLVPECLRKSLSCGFALLLAFARHLVFSCVRHFFF
jgi:hypothetical protein